MINNRLFIAVFILVSIFGCATAKTDKEGATAPPEKVVVRQIEAKEVRTMQEQGTDFLLVDVRPASGFNEKHIEGAISIPYTEIFYKKLPMNKEIILYCGGKKCPTAAQAANELLKMGYGKIGILRGGLKGWENKGYPVVDRETKKPVTVAGITADELKKKIDAGEDIFLIDVREEDEFKAGHISGAINVPVKLIEKKMNTFPEDKEVIIYCRSSKNCLEAAEKLLQKGFTKVKTMLGGIIVWEKRGFPLVIGKSK